MAAWTLPAEWPTTLPNLQYLLIDNLNIRGSLPASWTAAGTWAKLQVLDLPANFISGERSHLTCTCKLSPYAFSRAL